METHQPQLNGITGGATGFNHIRPVPDRAAAAQPEKQEAPSFQPEVSEQYANDRMMEYLLNLSGIQCDVSPKPEYFEMTVRVREASLEKSSRSIHRMKEIDEDESNATTGKGIRANAELSKGVQMWSPVVFLAQDKTFTLPWTKKILGHGRETVKDGDQRMIEA